MRKGMNGLALQVQQALGRDPHAGDLYVFRGARGDLLKIVWHDGIGMSLYAKRLERGRFIWPSPADGVVAISAAQFLGLHARRPSTGEIRLRTATSNILGEHEDWLHELSIDMFPEDGCLHVYGPGEDGVTAFTKSGIECLRQITADERAAGRAPRQIKPTK